MVRVRHGQFLLSTLSRHAKPHDSIEGDFDSAREAEVWWQQTWAKFKKPRDATEEETRTFTAKPSYYWRVNSTFWKSLNLPRFDLTISNKLPDLQRPRFSPARPNFSRTC